MTKLPDLFGDDPALAPVPASPFPAREPHPQPAPRPAELVGAAILIGAIVLLSLAPRLSRRVVPARAETI